MLHDVLETADTSLAIVNIVKDAVVAAIAWSNTVKGTGEEAEFEAISTSSSGFLCVTEFALVTDRGTEGPAAGRLVEVGETTGFVGSPHVIALCGSAGCGAAEAADKYFVKNAVSGAHFEISNKNYLINSNELN